jgi:4a-hydroxytetrahydrobiopterin dehydratase
MNDQIHQKHCVPCQKGTAPFTEAEAKKYMDVLDKSWQLVDGHHLLREFRFQNFKQALDFTNQIGAIAEIEGHHPDILLGWGKVVVTLWTHKINGLSENDFILAAKIDAIK